jgi:NAD(P)-dependent dehydrogenase (short-subunit alcohol dehydrogenase family)
MGQNKRTAIVTGGAQGIGKNTAFVLLNNGYRVVVADSDTEAGNELVSELQNNKNLHFCKTDVSSEEDVKKLVNTALEKFGTIDVLINNAAISFNKPVTELTLSEWNSVIGTNLTGTFLCTKYAAPYLKIASGAIVNICSTRALMSEKETEAYSASKGGILALTHALAISLGPEIRVNAISPGWIDVSQMKKQSAMQEIELSDADHTQHPAGRVGKADDISSMILFLIDPANSFITGQNFVIDGGMTKKMIYL